MGARKGAGEQAVEQQAGEVRQIEGEQEELVGLLQGEFEGAFGTGGFVDPAVVEGFQRLTDDPPVGQAGFRQQDARRRGRRGDFHGAGRHYSHRDVCKSNPKA